MTIETQVEQAYDESRNAIFSYFLCCGLIAAEAQDLTQEVYLRLYRTMQKGARIENLRGWLFRVAHNLALKVRTRDKAFSVSALDWERLAAAAISPEDRLLQRERMSRVTEALDSLSAQQRNCLYLRAEGLRYREIAEVMNIKTSTVGEFLARAMRRLAEAVND